MFNTQCYSAFPDSLMTLIDKNMLDKASVAYQRSYHDQALFWGFFGIFPKRQARSAKMAQESQAWSVELENKVHAPSACKGGLVN